MRKHRAVFITALVSFGFFAFSAGSSALAPSADFDLNNWDAGKNLPHVSLPAPIPAAAENPKNYESFLAYLTDIFCGANKKGISFVKARCLRTVNEILSRQNYYTGPGYKELRAGSCNEAIRKLRKAGLIKEHLTQAELEQYAMKGPVVALIAGNSVTQHVGILALYKGEVKFFSNSLGTKKIEPLSKRAGTITGIVILE